MHRNIKKRKSLKAKQTIFLLENPRKSKPKYFSGYLLEHTSALHGWQVNEHSLPALWVMPQASSAARQRNSSQIFTPIAQQPSSFQGKIL